MAQMYGWAGKILRVDLTTGTIRTTPTTDYVPKFMGGRGICDKIYWDEVPPQVQAFDAENKLIFATGPAAATLAPESGRLHLVGKAPWERGRPYPDAAYPKDLYHTSNAGGYLARELKKAGYDGLVVEGKSSKPVYICIQDDKVEIRDASVMVGLGVFDKQKIIAKTCGDDAVAMCIGQAGENLNRTAVITGGLTDTFGTGGFGAVMGSKKLLAIVIKGTGGIKVADPKRLIEVFYRVSRATTRKETEMVGFDAVDVNGNMAHYRGKVYKIRSWNYYESFNELEGTVIGEKVAKGLAKFKFRSCSDCPVCCRLVISFDDSPHLSGTCKELQEYYNREKKYYGTTKTVGEATLAHAILAGDWGLSVDPDPGYMNNLEAMAKAGILNPQNTGIPFDKIGSKEYITTLWQMIAFRQGIGNLLAEGTKSFMRNYSKEGEALYKTLFETKKKPATTLKVNSLLVATNFLDHGQFWWNFQRASKKFLYGFAQGSDEDKKMQMVAGKAWFGSEKAMDDSTWELKPMVARYYTYYLIVVDSLPACVWGSPAWYNLYTDDHMGDVAQLTDTYSAVTGIATTDADIRRVGERIWNLERAIAVREGRTRKHDWGWLDETASEAAELMAALDQYYSESGWDKATGWPTKAKLEELDLKDVADGLAKLGKLP